MLEHEFLLALNEMTISSDYDDEYFRMVFCAIRDFCNADSIDSLDDKDGVVGDDKNDLILVQNVVVKNVKRKFDDKDFFIRFVNSVLNNMFKNRELFQQYRKEKYTDSLLQVNNRMAYDDLLKRCDFKNVGVAFIDANGLGVINNVYGHDFGDILLKTVAGCFKKFFRHSDIYRIGGDELVIICDNISKDVFTGKIGMALEAVDKTEYSVSIGMVYSESTSDLQHIVKDASIMMKKNKEAYRKSHPEKYINKYEVSHVDKLNNSDEYKKIL